MHAPCPSCNTQYFIKDKLPGMSNGVITCLVCKQHFDVVKRKNIIGMLKIETKLRQHQTEDTQDNLKHEING